MRKRRRWWLAPAVMMPLVLFCVLAERASWRPRVFSVGRDNTVGRDADSLRLFALSDDGRKVVTMQPLAGGAEVWDTGSGKRLRHTRESGLGLDYNVAASLKLNPRYPQFAVAGNKGILLFDELTGKLQRRLDGLPIVGRRGGYEQHCYSPDGGLLAAERYGVDFEYRQVPRGLHLWDTATGKLLWAKPPLHVEPADLVAAAFSPDGASILVVTNCAEARHSYGEVYAARSGRSLRSFRLPATCLTLRFHPDGTSVLTSGDRNGQMSVNGIDATTGALRYSIQVPQDVAYLIPTAAFSHDGAVLAVAFPAGLNHVASSDRIPALALHDAHSGAQLRTINAPGNLTALAFRNDDRHLIGVTRDGTVFDWRVR